MAQSLHRSLFLVVVLTSCQAAALQAQVARKVALLIGVEAYEKKGFSNLSFAEDDMSSLHDVLKAQGFEVTLLLASLNGKSKANRQNIVDAINKQFIPTLKELGKQDIALVAMAGHGRHQVVNSGGQASEDHFYCPCDAHDSDAGTWISISTLITNIEKNSGSERNLILVDACRDNPSRGRGVDGKGFSLNRDAVAVLFASSYNEQAYEPDELKHGLFTYYVLDALAGKAKNFDDEITWDSLVDFVKGRVESESNRLKSANKIAGIQRPNSIGNLRGKSPVLAKLGSKSVSRPAILKAPFSEAEATARAEQWATFKKLPSTVVTKAAGIEMVLLPPGEFLMGNDEPVDSLMTAFASTQGITKEWFADADPQHRVEITKLVLLGRTEVTLGQFKSFVSETKHRTDAESDGKGGYGYDKANKTFAQKPEFNYRETGFEQSDSHPVVNVSWNDAVAFCNWLSRKEGLAECYRLENGQVTIVGGRGYRLPTEAEWEYACRAGTTTRYFHGQDPEGLIHVGNTWDSGTKESFPNALNQLKGSDRSVFTAAVARYRSNAFGLFDMHGNVLEWCQDRYQADYYQTSPTRDPQGPQSGSSRVLRGGSWNYDAADCRSADRNSDDLTSRSVYVGFRVLVELE